MKYLILPIIAVLSMASLISCGSATAYMKTASGTEVALIAPGMFSKQVLKNAHIKTSSGLDMHVEAYASRQPDPDVTAALKAYGLMKLTAPILQSGVDGNNAATLKGTHDPNVIPANPNVIPKNPNIILEEGQSLAQ